MTGPKSTILILDDSVIMRKAISAHLSKEGYTLLEATTCAEFFEVLAKNENYPDLFLIDLILTDGHGREVITDLRLNSRFKNHPVIVLTSAESSKEIDACFEAGADDYIHKPWSATELRARVRNHLDRSYALQNLTAAKVEWEDTFNAVPDLIALLDLNRQIVRVNKAMSDKMGFTAAECIGKNCCSCFYFADYPEGARPCRATLKEGKSSSLVIYSPRLHGHFDVSTSPIFNSRGEMSGLVHVARDISDRVRLEEKLTYEASHDLMTGLKNHSSIVELLSNQIASARRFQLPLSFSLADLDNFKQVNDRYGHQVGDEVLIAFANILKQEMREGDFVGRYGGEEFALVLPHTGSAGAEIFLERVRKKLEEVMFISHLGEEFKVTGTFGISEYTQEMDLDALVASADQALYRGKEAGRNRVVVAAGSK